MTRGLRERIDTGPPVLLDGPTGTQLESRGVDTGGPIWSTRAVLERPDAVRAVHRDYVDAGAEVLTAVTFRADRRSFRRAGKSEEAWQEAVHAAVRLAREAADEAPQPVWVAGSLAPLGDCYAPEEVPVQEVLVDEHGRFAEVLKDAGVDLILVETMNTVREAEAAARAARATGSRVWVSLIVQEGARLLSQEPLAPALAALRQEADVLLVNCASVPSVDQAIPVLRESGRPWGAYANGSLQGPRTGWSPEAEVGPKAYVDAARSWLDQGSRVLGSCCGTGPAHIRALRALLDGR